jgi:hypothetical protein
MTNNFPINKIDIDDKVIAINTNVYDKKSIKNVNEKTENFKIHEYIYDIICQFVNKEGENFYKKFSTKNNCDIINIKLYNVSAINFSLSNNTKLDIFSEGYQISKKKMLKVYYKNYKTNLKSNRFSINDA